MVNLGLARVVRPPRYAGDTRVILDGALHVLYYTYPDFVLLKSRAAGFLELGLSWEP